MTERATTTMTAPSPSLERKISIGLGTPALLFRPNDPDDELSSAKPLPSMFQAAPNTSFLLVCLTYWTALRMAFAHLVTYETIFVSLTSAGSVVFYTLFRTTSSPDNDNDHDEPLVAKLSLSFITFLLVFPITANIGYAFARREKALQAMAGIKTYILHIYVAHRDWAFDSKGCPYSGRNLIHVTVNGQCNPRDVPQQGSNDMNSSSSWSAEGGIYSKTHTDEVRHVMVHLIRAMRDFLALPLVNRSIHLYSQKGRKAREIVRPIQQNCLQDVYEQMQRLTLAVERLKEAGLPGNEAARINQYHSLLMIQWENARFLKAYRTPTGLRAFARLYILVHPFFMGPYYAWVAGAGIPKTDEDDDTSWPFQTNLAFAIALAVFTGVALQGLYNVEVGMEDPFDESEGLDDVRLNKTFREMERLISMEWAPHAWNDTVMKGRSLLDVEFKDSYAKLPEDIPREGLPEAWKAIEEVASSMSCF